MNVSSLLHDQYKRIPRRLAVSVPKKIGNKYHYTDYTFSDLEKGVINTQMYSNQKVYQEHESAFIC